MGSPFKGMQGGDSPCLSLRGWDQGRLDAGMYVCMHVCTSFSRAEISFSKV